MAIHGTHFWEVEPYAVIPPFMATFSGDGAVPVWFVPMSVMEAALQDGVLTIGELTGLSGLLVGYASRFNLSVPEACAHCGGADSSSFHPCAVCRESGAVKEQMQVEISFPPGMRDRQRSHLSPTSLGILHLHLSLTFTIHSVFL